MNHAISRLLSPTPVLLGVAAVSVLALAAAFASEAFLGLEPCKLCIYQRWPYAIAAAICLAAYAAESKCPKAPLAALLASALAFLINSGIALYHSGVERHWWKSALDGCLVPNMGTDSQSILENILSAPAGRCDEIPWADPVFGLSLANYNVVMGLALFGVCAAALVLTLKRLRPEA